MPDYRILIVGAGIAGLACARTLRSAGFSPEIVERATAWQPEGAGIYIPANGGRALRALGLWEPVATRAATIPRQRFLDHRGRLLGDIDLHRVWGECGPCLALHRSDLHQVLREGAARTPIRMGTTPRSLDQDGGVRVGFGDGTSGEYDLVVGADGIRSTVRRLAVDPRPPIPRGQLSWRFVTSCPPGITTWTTMLGRGRAFLTIPIGQGLVYCYADEPDHRDRAEPAGGNLERLRAAFADFGPPVPEILEWLDESTHLHVAPIEEVAAERWGRGRVVLIGDAAHGMSPNMAEGASLAFEDALTLADSLRGHPTIEAALVEFVRLRHPRTAWVRQQTHRRDSLRSFPSPLRTVILRAFGQRMFVSNYRPLKAPLWE
jgi:2-polyprenyl-6-methoxyphenol hydroxylase-like FAD-dependent oxidoreductase